MIIGIGRNVQFVKIKIVYQNKIQGQLDKQILKYIIQSGKKIRIPRGTKFARTCNSRNMLPSHKITYMNCNGRGNYKIYAGALDSVIILETKKELVFSDLTDISFILGCQIKAGKERDRGLFSSCCKIPDIISICRELRIDGIINFDSIDNVRDEDFVDDREHDIGYTLPYRYKKYIEEDMRNFRCSPSFTDRRIEYTYPEFVIVDHNASNPRSTKMKIHSTISYSNFYNNERYYSRNFYDFRLSRFDSNTIRSRGSQYIGLGTLPMIHNSNTNYRHIDDFFNHLSHFMTEQIRSQPNIEKDRELARKLLEWKSNPSIYRSLSEEEQKHINKYRGVLYGSEGMSPDEYGTRRLSEDEIERQARNMEQQMSNQIGLRETKRHEQLDAGLSDYWGDNYTQDSSGHNVFRSSQREIAAARAAEDGYQDQQYSQRSYQDPQREIAAADQDQQYSQRGYQDPQRGYQDPQRGYQDQQYSQRGYQDPQRGYQDPQRGYQDPQRGYQDPQRGYQDPQRGYQDPQRGYQDPQYSQRARDVIAAATAQQQQSSSGTGWS